MPKKDRGLKVPSKKRSGRVTSFEDIDLRYWTWGLQRKRSALAIPGFFLILTFGYLAFESLFLADTTGTLNVRGLSLFTFWLGLFSYFCWKAYELFVWRYRIEKREVGSGMSSFLLEVALFFGGLIHSRNVKVLFFFGIAYTFLLNVLWILHK
ncbi:hypothetical protein [Tengunoibacter tsumagoiensis]|uniref:hypothetical protein n=1 Tax=Tengunoibacter tsumagoiensis TaxID=2014871 RepID=UPI000F82B847|nr:hypothetical protein [Tengunoibacter tsumagoiensis]